MSSPTVPSRISTKTFLSGPLVEKTEAIWIRGRRPGRTQPTEGVQSEDGALNRTSTILLVENLILRSKKRLNSGRSETPIQGVPSGYGFYRPTSVVFLFLIFTRSQDREERRKESGFGGRDGGQRADG